MSLQYISDIHLEHYNINQIDKLIPNKLSEILILAGDIGYPEQTQYKMYIDKVSKIWSKVFIISGNHEYYQTSKKIKNKEEIDLIIESIVEDYSNVYYLNNSKIEFEYDGKNFVILGTTLFSLIEKDNYSLQISINDFKYIYTKRTVTKYNTYDYHKLNLLTYRNYYDESISFLEKEINYYKNTDINIIIVTHYAPSFECIDNVYKNSKLNKAYYSDLEYLIKDLYCWIHGHTHSQKVVKINGISILNNSIGYKDDIDLDKIILERVYDKKIRIETV